MSMKLKRSETIFVRNMEISRLDANGLRAKLVSGFGNYILLYFVRGDVLDIARIIRGGQEIDQIALNLS